MIIQKCIKKGKKKVSKKERKKKRVFFFLLCYIKNRTGWDFDDLLSRFPSLSFYRIRKKFTKKEMNEFILLSNFYLPNNGKMLFERTVWKNLTLQLCRTKLLFVRAVKKNERGSTVKRIQLRMCVNVMDVCVLIV